MKRYRFAVCRGSDCRRLGADKVHAAAREEVRRLGLASRCEVYRGGCYGLCHLGPNVVVREERGERRDPLGQEEFTLVRTEGEAYYWAMSPEKALRVVTEHVVQDRIASDLLGDPERKDDLRERPSKG